MNHHQLEQIRQERYKSGYASGFVTATVLCVVLLACSLATLNL